MHFPLLLTVATLLAGDSAATVRGGNADKVSNTPRDATRTNAPRDLRDRVLAVLGAQESALSAAEWYALGPGVDVVLVGIAADTQTGQLVRVRALTALGQLPTRGTRDFLSTFVKQHAADDRAADKLLLRKAALSLGWVGGTAAADILAPLLEHEDADVRLDAAIALGLTRTRDAADWLRQRFDVEKDQRVRTQIGRQLRIQAEASAPAAASDTK